MLLSFREISGTYIMFEPYIFFVDREIVDRISINLVDRIVQSSNKAQLDPKT